MTAKFYEKKETMPYELRVSIHKEGDRDDYYGHTMFLQIFEELDLAALAIFLNQPERQLPVEKIWNDTVSIMTDQIWQSNQDEPSSQGMPA